MRILIPESINVNASFYQFASPELRAMGHIVETYDPDEWCEQFGIELARRLLIDKVRQFRPDVVLAYPPYDLLRSEDGDAIRATGAHLVGFAYDDQIFMESYKRLNDSNSSGMLDEMGDTYSLYTTTSREFLNYVKNEPLNTDFKPKHMLWAVNKPASMPDWNSRDIPVIMIGQAYPRRVEMVRALLEKNIPIRVFGSPGWKDYPDVAAKCYGGPLKREDMFKMYRRAKIALAPADWEANSIPMVKLRALEVVSCGACLVHEDCPDLHDYWEDNQEVVSFDAGKWEHLIDTIDLLLTVPYPTDEIAKNGYDRLCRDHTWAQRWPQLEAMLPPVVVPMVNLMPSPGWRNAERSTTSFPENDPSLPAELAQMAAAGHYELSQDYESALNLYQTPKITFAGALGAGRCLFEQQKYLEAAGFFHTAIGLGRSLCPLSIDSTMTQRKFGPRKGLGHLFRGIFPRWLEAEIYLLLIDGLTNDMGDAAERIDYLPDDDHRFIALSGTMTNETEKHPLSPMVMLEFARRLCDLKPRVWAFQHKSHLAEFWMIQAIACMDGEFEHEGMIRQMLETALKHNPKKHVMKMINQRLDFLNRSKEIVAPENEPDYTP